MTKCVHAEAGYFGEKKGLGKKSVRAPRSLHPETYRVILVPCASAIEVCDYALIILE